MNLTRCAWVVGVTASAMAACSGQVSTLPGDESSTAGSATQSAGRPGSEQPVGAGGWSPESAGASNTGGTGWFEESAGAFDPGDSAGSAGDDGSSGAGGEGSAGESSAGFANGGTAGYLNGGTAGFSSGGTAGFSSGGTAGFANGGTAGHGNVVGLDGLRASYSFDELSGSYATEALSQAQAPIYLASRLPGVFGNALGFGAPLARAELFPVGYFSTEQITIELWIRPGSLAPSAIAHLVGDGGGGIESFRVQLQDGKVALLLSPGQGYAAEPVLLSKSSVQIGLWQLITVTFDGSTARVYLNGAQDAAEPVLLPVPFSGNRVYVGALPIPASQAFKDQFDGAIDEVKVWEKALSPAAVAAHFQAAN